MGKRNAVKENQSMSTNERFYLIGNLETGIRNAVKGNQSMSTSKETLNRIRVSRGIILTLSAEINQATTLP